MGTPFKRETFSNVQEESTPFVSRENPLLLRLNVMVFKAKSFLAIASALLLLTLFQLSLAYAAGDESAEQGFRKRGLGKLGFLQNSWEPSPKRQDPNLSIDNSLEGLKRQLEHRQKLLELEMEQELLSSLGKR